MQVRQFEDRSIEEISLARLDDAICAVKEAMVPPGTTVESLLKADRQGDAMQARFEEWDEIARSGRITTAPKLRTSAPEPDSGEEIWTPGNENVDLGLNK